jgi:hypothetical protein
MRFRPASRFADGSRSFADWLKTARISLRIAANFMKNERDIVREFLAKAGSKGGKARAAKHSKATLSKWAKKGGRPKSSGKKGKA